MQGGAAIPRKAKRPNIAREITPSQQSDLEKARIVVRRLCESGLQTRDVQGLLFPNEQGICDLVSGFDNSVIDLHIVEPVPIGLLLWANATTDQLLGKTKPEQHAALNFSGKAAGGVWEQTFENHSYGARHCCSIMYFMNQAGVLASDDVPLCVLECKRWQQEWRDYMAGEGKVKCFRCLKQILKSDVSPDVVATRRVIGQALLLNKQKGVPSNGVLALSFALSWTSPLPDIFKPGNFTGDKIMAVMPCCKGTCNPGEKLGDDFDDRVKCLAKLLEVSS